VLVHNEAPPSCRGRSFAIAMASLRRFAFMAARQTAWRTCTTQPPMAPVGALARLQRRGNSSEVCELAKAPTLEQAKKMPVHISELSNEALYILAENGHYGACAERLARHIMSIDEVEWMVGKDKVKEIQKADESVHWVAMLPYKVGISIGVGSGVACVPLCFHQPTVHAFNERFVTSEVPEPADLETAWEVGSWAWNWMEPPLGVAGFVLLTMQLTRSQMQNMGVKPYTQWMKNWRGRRLARMYPQYDADLIRAFVVNAF